MTKTKKEELQPRSYQLLMLEEALKSNIIACLGTGTGKTFIGVLVLKHLSHQVRLAFEQGGKRSFFLVPTVPLVHQQAKVLETLTDLKIGSFYGDMKVDTWSQEQWLVQFKEYNVLVMTAEIFRVIVEHGFLPLSRVNLIIFDECHRAVKNHPYREIMKNFDTCTERPRILGLTASILNGKCKAGQLEKRIKDLEQTLRSRAIIPRETSEVDAHKTKPKEVLLNFSAHSAYLENEDVNTIRTLLVKALSEMPETRSSPKRSGVLNPQFDISDDEAEDINPLKDARKYITDIKDILDTLGVWCAQEGLLAFLREVGSSFEKGLIPLEKAAAFKIVQSVFEACLDIVMKLLEGENWNEHLVGPSAPSKLKKLLEVLNSKHPSQLTGDGELCGVIFVQKRLVAYILHKWLIAVSKLPQYNFIRSHFMVGHGSDFHGTDIKETCMNSKEQRRILEDFRSGKYNLLVASSVIEEGMDVPKCNLIVRFDPPIDYCAYVQSKGRARAKNSIYLLMIADKHDEEATLLEDLTNYYNIEKILKNFCQDRELPTEEEIDEHMMDALKEPYMPFPFDGGARVTMSSAIQLLNRYCSKLLGDAFTLCAPRWKVRKIEDDIGMERGFQCTIWMPLVSPIRDPILGQVMKTKQAAKMAAALDTCRILHEQGELDNNLLPINFKETLMDEGYRKELREGASKKQGFYPKKMLSFEPVKGDGKCYFYVINMKLIQTVGRDETETLSFFDPSTSPYKFALVVSQQVKNLISFYMFTESGKVRVTFDEKGPYHLSSETVELIHHFHKYTFSEMLKVTPFPLRFIPEQNTQWLLAPVQFDKTRSSVKVQLCVELINRIVDYTKEGKDAPSMKSTSVFNSEDLLLCPSFEKDHLYYMISICNNMSAESPFPKEQFKSFQDYYERKLNYVIQNPQNPLIEAKHVSNPLYNIPGYFSQAGFFVTQSVTRLARRVHFPAELVSVLPYPASLHRQAMYLPCILSRANSLIFVQELQGRIVEEAKVGIAGVNWPSLDFPRFMAINEDMKKQMEIVLKGKEKAFQSLSSIVFDDPLESNVKQGPSPCLVLEGLTTKHYCDMLDLERLETVGDSFLKYAVSVHLFCKYPHDNEGKLTVRKTKQISNANLLKLGVKKGIPSIMCNKKMSPNDNWLAPGFRLPPAFEETQAKCALKVTQHWISTEMPNIWEMSAEEITSKLESLHETIKRNIAEQCGPEASYAMNVSLDLRTMNSVGNKTVADCVEGLIGAYVVTIGVMGGLRFLDWLGVEVFPEDEKPVDLESCFKIPPQFVRDSTETAILKEQYFSGLENLENSINYVFRNKMYLLEALWHPSCDSKPITECYQRLEFLGDAVLDYLITRYLYEDPKHYNPGELTDIRMSLVNNDYFARLAVKYKFHQQMRYFAPGLVGAIISFVKKVDNNDMNFFEEVSVEEKNDGAAEELEVPKVLGDVVESVAGAIYLDSGLSLKTVWNVFFGLMKKDIEARRENVPKNPVRELYELYPSKVKFQKHEELPGKKIKVSVEIDNGTHRFIGIASNKKTAKLTAAKIALHKLCRRRNNSS